MNIPIANELVKNSKYLQNTIHEELELLRSQKRGGNVLKKMKIELPKIKQKTNVFMDTYSRKHPYDLEKLNLDNPRVSCIFLICR